MKPPRHKLAPIFDADVTGHSFTHPTTMPFLLLNIVCLFACLLHFGGKEIERQRGPTAVFIPQMYAMAKTTPGSRNSVQIFLNISDPGT